MLPCLHGLILNHKHCQSKHVCSYISMSACCTSQLWTEFIISIFSEYSTRKHRCSYLLSPSIWVTSAWAEMHLAWLFVPLRMSSGLSRVQQNQFPNSQWTSFSLKESFEVNETECDSAWAVRWSCSLPSFTHGQQHRGAMTGTVNPGGVKKVYFQVRQQTRFISVITIKSFSQKPSECLFITPPAQQA